MTIEHLNKVDLKGFINSEIELEKFEDGRRCRSFDVQTNCTFTNGKGIKKECQDKHRILLWNSLADVTENLKRYDVVYVSGRLRNNGHDGKFMNIVIAEMCNKMKE